VSPFVIYTLFAFQAGGKAQGVPRMPVGAPQPQPRPPSNKKTVAPAAARLASPARAKNAPLELGEHQDLEYHPHLRTQTEIPPLQIPELKLTQEAQAGAGARQSLPSPTTAPSSNDDFQEVCYRRKPAQGNKTKEVGKI
jgi:hypothetical protein